MQAGQICPPRTSKERGGARCHGRYLQAFFLSTALSSDKWPFYPPLFLFLPTTHQCGRRERGRRKGGVLKPSDHFAQLPISHHPSAIRSLLLVVWESRGVKEERDRVAGAGGEEEEEETDRFSSLLFFTNMKERSAHSVALRTKHQSRDCRENESVSLSWARGRMEWVDFLFLPLPCDLADIHLSPSSCAIPRSGV